jgi:hypothetical protein
VAVGTLAGRAGLSGVVQNYLRSRRPAEVDTRSGAEEHGELVLAGSAR